MYICKYECMFMCVCMYVYIHVCMFVGVCMGEHTFFIHVCMYVYIHKFVCMYVHTFVCTYVCIHAYMHAYMYVCLGTFSLTRKDDLEAFPSGGVLLDPSRVELHQHDVS